MKRTILVGAIVAALVVSAVAAGASATPAASKWTRISDSSGDNTDQVALARTGDGVLHVSWMRQRGRAAYDLMHTAVGRGAATPIVTGLGQIDNPDLVATRSGLRVVFGAASSQQDKSLKFAAAGGDGAGWTVQSIPGTTHAYASPVGAAVDRAGTLLASWATPNGVEVLPGVDTGAVAQKVAGTEQCCTYQPDLAIDGASGETVVAWGADVRTKGALYASRVLPSPGPRVLLPGSNAGGDAVALDQRIAITARLRSPGVYLAYGSGYPSAKRVLVWKFGGGAPLVAGRSPDVEDVNIAAGPDGRLWVMWHDGQRRTLIHAVRSNRAATCLGAVVPVAAPRGQRVLWKLSGEGSLGSLDLFASASSTLGAKPATWHTRVSPGLTVAARGGRVVTLRVTDACDPVAGATVKIGGRALKTTASGVVRVDLPAGRFAASASKAGYAPSSAVRVASK